VRASHASPDGSRIYLTYGFPGNYNSFQGNCMGKTKLASTGLEVHLGYWLRRVSNHVSGTFARALQHHQVSVAEWVVLSQIAAHQESRPAELADQLGLTRGAVSKVLDKLEGKKWTTRRISPDDNRVQILSLTHQGERVLPQLGRIADDNDTRFFDCLEAKEQGTLRRLLQKLTDFHQIQGVPVE
jgi:DNA-binding MarR family transcriptional regulator